MARPAIVIGLGGSGRWILTDLKKELLEVNHGVMPKEVKLLAFDTNDNYSPESCKRDDPIENEGTNTSELVKNVEYVNIGSDLSQIIHRINDSKITNLKWLKNNKVIAELPEAALNCVGGTGGVRNLGRLCLLNDIQSVSRSKIIHSLSSVMKEIFSQIDNNPIEIIVVGSLAGGTGSSMLVDMAMLCRNLAPAYLGNFNSIYLRGFLITPRAFSGCILGDTSQRMLANSFAAWRELDRFMISNRTYGGNRIRYSENDPSLEMKTERRLFDVAYMIDPIRSENALQPGEPEKDLFPAIAEVISVILDSKTGRSFSDLAINLSCTYISYPCKPLYSAIGAYTMKLPVDYQRMKFTYELAMEALTILLAPELLDGKVKSLNDGYNAEVENNKPNLTSVLDFLLADNIDCDGKILPNTLLSKRIAAVRKKNGCENASYIKQVAASNLPDERDAMGYSLQDENGIAILQELLDEMDFHIWQDVKLSRDIGRNPNADTEQDRINLCIAHSRLIHLGDECAINDGRGHLGRELEKAKEMQESLFSAYLAAFTEKILNGTSANSEEARGGKLGYAISFCEKLIETIEYYIDFLKKLNDARSKVIYKSSRARIKAIDAWDNYVDNPHKTSGWIFWNQNIHPSSYKLQHEYLLAEDQVNEVIKEDILINFASQTATEWKKIVKAELENLHSWEVCLAKGTNTSKSNPMDPMIIPTREIKGFFQVVQDRLADINVNFKTNRWNRRTSELMDPVEFQHSTQDVQDFLSRIYWKVTPTNLKRNLSDQPIRSKAVGIDCKLMAYHKETPREFLKDGVSAIDANIDILWMIAGELFSKLVQNDSLQSFPLAVMQQMGTNTGGKLAEHLHHKAEPFYLRTNGGIGPIHNPHPRTALVCVQSQVNTEVTQYFTDPVEGFHTKLATSDQTVFFEELVNSSDETKLAYIRFDDCIISQDFDVWQRCRDAYISFADNKNIALRPEDFHVFPAEINACRYERKIMEVLQRNYRILDPVVVLLLDDDQHVELFFQALAFGMIKKNIVPSSKETYWVYQQPNGRIIQLTHPIAESEKFQGVDYFDLMSQFCNNACDIRPECGENFQFMVNWDGLQSAILERQNETPRKDLIQAYENQIDGDDGIVRILHDFVEERRKYSTSPVESAGIALAHQDLADLAETIFRLAINKVEDQEA